MTTNPKTSSERDALTQLYARRQAGYATLYVATLAEDYAPDAVVESPFAGQHSGRDVEEKLKKLVAFFVDLSVELEDPLIDGNRVAQIGVMTGNGTTGVTGLPPTTRAFRMPVAVFYEMQGLQIVRERRVYDSTGLWVQSGLLTVKPT